MSYDSYNGKCRTMSHQSRKRLSAIKYDSTCISLGLPYSLACSNCGPLLDPLSMNRKGRQKKDIKVNNAGVSSIGIPLGHKGKMQQKVIH